MHTRDAVVETNWQLWWNGISPQVIRTLTLAYRSIVAYVPEFSLEKLSMREVSGSDVKVIH